MKSIKRPRNKSADVHATILTEGNNFGYGVAGIGDYNNDGIPDIAVAAPLTSDQAIYIIHLNADGTVKSHVKNANIACLGITAVGDLVMTDELTW